VVLTLGLAFLFVLAGLWVVQKVASIPGAALDKTTTLIKELGHQAATVAEGFRHQTIRQEFLSSSMTLAGTTRLQVATLQEDELFRRSERDSMVWGLVSLPAIVVEATLPVEYTYYLDFNGSWEFDRENNVVTVHAPPLQANSPAPDVSRLQFYTVERHIWQDDKAVRDRLQSTLSPALRERAQKRVPQVREIARLQLAAFVEKWLADSFRDGHAFHVNVVFPGEIPSPSEDTSPPRIKPKD
jgi:hypothetical protein